MKPSTQLLALVAGLGLVSAASAQVTVASYTFTGASLEPTTENLAFVDASTIGITTNLANNSNLYAGSIDATLDFTDVFFITTDRTQATSATAGSMDHFFSFSVTTNQALNFGALSLDYAYSHTGNNNGFFVRSSVDNFATDLLLVGGSGSLNVSQTMGNYSVSLSAIPVFQNIAAGTTITFRFMGIDSAASSGRRHNFDNIALTASAIPEPSSIAALAGLGALGFVAARRRRR
jgi:hypothetical protein